MPTAKRIREFWAPLLVWSGKAETADDVLEPYINGQHCCFRCGNPHVLERAHIHAVTAGGSNRAANLHLLCRACHTESEMLPLDQYWRWFSHARFEPRAHLFRRIANRSGFASYEEMQTALRGVRPQDAKAMRHMVDDFVATVCLEESRQGGERTKRGLANAKARGVRLGGTRHRIISSERSRAESIRVNKAKAMRFAASILPIIESIEATGVTSLRDIAAALAARGIATRRGVKWSATQVARILKHRTKPQSNAGESLPLRPLINRIIMELKQAGVVGVGNVAAELNKRGVQSVDGAPWSGASVSAVLRGDAAPPRSCAATSEITDTA